MNHLAKIFQNGRSQAVRLPSAFRFKDCKEVYVHKDPKTGDIILSQKPSSWEDFFKLTHAFHHVTKDFMVDREDSLPQERDIL